MAGPDLHDAIPGAPRLWPSLLTGVVAAVLVLVPGALLLDRYEPGHTASATLLLLPDASLSQEVAAGYFEQLNGTRVASTYAAVLREKAASAGEPGARPATVEVVTDTSLLRVTAAASSAPRAEAAADRAARQAVQDASLLQDPFRLEVVTSADGTAAPAGTPVRTLVVVGVLVAVLGAVAAQQTHLLLVRALLLRRGRPTGAPVPLEGAAEPPARARPRATGAGGGQGSHLSEGRPSGGRAPADPDGVRRRAVVLGPGGAPVLPSLPASGMPPPVFRPSGPRPAGVDGGGGPGRHGAVHRSPPPSGPPRTVPWVAKFSGRPR